MSKKARDRAMSVINDGQYHHITFSKKDKWMLDHVEANLDVYLDGVKITDDDSDLAVKIFEHGIWFKFQPLPKPEEFKK